MEGSLLDPQEACAMRSQASPQTWLRIYNAKAKNDPVRLRLASRILKQLLETQPSEPSPTSSMAALGM